MDKSTLDTIIDAYHSDDPTYVCFFNNGEVKEDGLSVNEKMDAYHYDDTLSYIPYYLKKATLSFKDDAPFDQVTMGLKVGLVYNVCDVDEEGKIKANAEPIKGIARCYFDDVNCYLDGKKANKRRFDMYGNNGFVNYNKLVSYARENKLDFTGPETFEFFKAAILSGEKFDVEVSANINKSKDNVAYNNNRQKALRKIPFFKRNR